MYKPKFPEGKPSIFICSNNDDSKKPVIGILNAFRFEIADMGKVQAARAIKPLSILMLYPGSYKKSMNLFV